jgi:hypothetical protein
MTDREIQRQAAELQTTVTLSERSSLVRGRSVFIAFG